MTIAVCALCRKDRGLVVSHIVPRFIGKRQKADAPKPFLRNISSPGKREQDLPKTRLLCRECEDRFSSYEDPFARDIFTPTMNGVILNDLVVTREHHRFCTSVFWRSLVAAIAQKNDPELDFNAADWERMDEVEVALRRFQLEKDAHPQDIEHHLFNARTTTESAVPGINALLNLTSGYSIRGWNDYPDRLYGVVFMNGLLQISLLRSTPESRSEWDGGATRIQPGGLWRNHRQNIRDGVFGAILIGLAQEMVEERDRLSPAHNRVIEDSMKDVKFSDWVKSPHGRAVIQDHMNNRQTN